MLIRSATEADWPRIWPFFAAIVAAGETYAYPEAPPAHTVVAVEGDEVLGSAKMGPNRPTRGAHIATASFMVDPAHAGKGIGRALGSYVVEWARAENYRGMQFNAVVETNAVAVRLWESLGFEILGTVPGAFNSKTHGYVGLHLMYQRL
jgi:GNAT superfamily N-acetyltransferase